jgi:hypothetical protein
MGDGHATTCMASCCVRPRQERLGLETGGMPGGGSDKQGHVHGCDEDSSIHFHIAEAFSFLFSLCLSRTACTYMLQVYNVDADQERKIN